MTEFQLEGGAAESMGENLISKADAEDRELAYQLANLLVDIAECCGVTWTVRKK